MKLKDAVSSSLVMGPTGSGDGMGGVVVLEGGVVLDISR
jgi:hypothetical protein